MTSPALDNADPTEAERKRMLAVLDGLRRRLNERGHDFGAPAFNEQDATVGLRSSEGGRERVTAWIHNDESRHICVWRDPICRHSADEAWLWEATRSPASVG